MEQRAVDSKGGHAGGRVCPHCSSADVRRSSRAAGLFHLTYRCRHCKRHFKVKVYRGYVILTATVLAISALWGAAHWFKSASAIEEIHTAALAATEISPAELALARRGDPAMQLKLGMHYWARFDDQNAFKWIKAAADRGQPEAIFQLGMAYLHGRGTLQNYKLAHQQFEQAARLNNHEAQYLLGIMYRDGMGVPVSHDLAYVWLNIAAANGNELARVERERLALIMSPTEMARAQERSVQEMSGSAHGRERVHAATVGGAPLP